MPITHLKRVHDKVQVGRAVLYRTDLSVGTSTLLWVQILAFFPSFHGLSHPTAVPEDAFYVGFMHYHRPRAGAIENHKAAVFSPCGLHTGAGA